ncbi:MAG: anthranilate synthase component I family protein [Verrucomicrobia bacterium]|nr:anthranilate synthase component I family protein [Verrucomicrobiota bacterium]
MHPLIHEAATSHTPESLVARLAGEPGVVLLRSHGSDPGQSRYSFVTARPMLTFRSFASRCEITTSRTPDARPQTQFGNPWRVLDSLMSRYELLDAPDLPFPLGGCFGYWGYDLKNFVEPKLSRRAVDDLELPDSHVGFHDSLVVFDHRLGKTWIIATGLGVDGSRSEERTKRQFEFWEEILGHEDLSNSPSPALPARPPLTPSLSPRPARGEGARRAGEGCADDGFTATDGAVRVRSNLTRAAFLARVERAQHYIRHGHIYQVNLSQRLSTPSVLGGWELFERLCDVSPAPFASFLDCGDFQIASSSPELFLRLSGALIATRPIKGTRPRSTDATRDAQLTYELQTSAKEMAELVMITDLLRNDLGRVCEFGSVQVPELVRLERFAQVQHLVSTVEGRLRAGVTHFAALASCFPGGSITGAPKFRAMEIIDELEPVARGPYTGCHGYLGFNRESQLSITIRTAVRTTDATHFNVGAGIVADSVPETEYEETLAKARGFLAALALDVPLNPAPALRRTQSPA